MAVDITKFCSTSPQFKSFLLVFLHTRTSRVTKFTKIIHCIGIIECNALLKILEPRCQKNDQWHPFYKMDKVHHRCCCNAQQIGIRDTGFFDSKADNLLPFQLTAWLDSRSNRAASCCSFSARSILVKAAQRERCFLCFSLSESRHFSLQYLVGTRD